MLLYIWSIKKDVVLDKKVQNVQRCVKLLYFHALGNHNMKDVSLVGSVLTVCQRQRQKALDSPVPGRFIPRCTPNGEFEEIQCHGSQCYCVDRNGAEKADTRVIRPNKPNCLVVPSVTPGNVSLIYYFG